MTTVTHEQKLTSRNMGYDQTGDRMVIAVCAANYWDGDLFDWAVYIGVVGMEREATQAEVEAIAQHGCKQLRDVAQAIFYYMPQEKFRD
jgi:hypothetical protein